MKLIEKKLNKIAIVMKDPRILWMSSLHVYSSSRNVELRKQCSKLLGPVI